jgi:hypothetical protein
VENLPLIRFEVLTAVSTKMAVFWVVAPCSLVKVYLWNVGKLLTYFYFMMITINMCM